MYLSEYLRELNLFYLYLIAILVGNLIFYTVRHCLKCIEDKKKIEINIFFIIFCFILSTVTILMWSFLASYALSRVISYLFDIDRWVVFRFLEIMFVTIFSHYCKYFDD